MTFFLKKIDTPFFFSLLICYLLPNVAKTLSLNLEKITFGIKLLFKLDGYINFLVKDVGLCSTLRSVFTCHIGRLF